VPISYEALTTPFDPTLPVQYKYIQDFMFDDADFMIVGVNEQEITNISSVSQNYPNPFSQSTTIRVNLERSADLSLQVTDILGREVMNIRKGAVDAGSYDFTLDGSKLQDGVYFYTVSADKNKITRKMIVR
jgi:flagellar hook assembly protein FlgD